MLKGELQPSKGILLNTFDTLTWTPSHLCGHDCHSTIVPRKTPIHNPQPIHQSTFTTLIHFAPFCHASWMSGSNNFSSCFQRALSLTASKVPKCFSTASGRMYLSSIVGLKRASRSKISTSVEPSWQWWYIGLDGYESGCKHTNGNTWHHVTHFQLLGKVTKEAVSSLRVAPAWAVPRYVVPTPWMRPPVLPRALPSRSWSGCIDTARRGCRASWKKAPRGRVLLLHFLLSLCEVRKRSDHRGWGNEEATIHTLFKIMRAGFIKPLASTSHPEPCAAEV